jgi:monofunctional biosynthetic peptidoglycan transglycosylase
VSGVLRRLLRWALLLAAAFYVLCMAGFVYLRWLPPLTTAVQIERRIQAMRAGRHYEKRATWAPLGRISKDFQHAVIAAEDGRFYEHDGIDWVELRKVVEADFEKGRLGRGGSTITQQLVKNLFLSTQRSMIRKGVEFALVPPAEWILSKQRILELYLNVIEWGPGIYGAEAAAQFYYHVPAARVNREQAARLASIIPAPLRRRPARMGSYSTEILRRMQNVGW